MAGHSKEYDKLFKLAFCKSKEGGEWDKLTEFASMEKIELGAPIQGDSDYTKSTVGLHPVVSWREVMSCDKAGAVSPNDLSLPRPGITQVRLIADKAPVGNLYRAFTGFGGNNLVNFKLFFFRVAQPGNKSEELHHYFTITGIAGRICGITQISEAGEGLATVQLDLSPNRISWYDHDTNTGGKLGWDAPKGQDVKPMPQSPLG